MSNYSGRWCLCRLSCLLSRILTAGKPANTVLHSCQMPIYQCWWKLAGLLLSWDMALSLPFLRCWDAVDLVLCPVWVAFNNQCLHILPATKGMCVPGMPSKLHGLSFVTPPWASATFQAWPLVGTYAIPTITFMLTVKYYPHLDKYNALDQMKASSSVIKWAVGG